jgi:hypothetical protein
MRVLVAGMAIALLLGACAGNRVGGTTATTMGTESQTDTSDLTPVSYSNPGAAAGAIESCLVDRYRAIVTGMAKVEHARDLPNYVPLTGLEPEIQTDDAAYVVRFHGDLAIGALVRGGGGGDWILRDPTCVVVGSDRSFFNTGGSYDVDGTERSPGTGIADPGGLPPLGP